MKRIYLLSLLVILLGIKAYPQAEPVVVIDKAIKIAAGDSAEFYFAFAKGDKINYSLSDINIAGIAEEQIIEYPSTTLVKRHKPDNNSGIEMKAGKKKIIRFSVYNTGKDELSCRIAVKRIPASSAAKDFLTNVVWVDKQDTTYKPIKLEGKTIYDTTITGYKTKVLVKSDKKEDLLIDKKITLKPAGNPNDSDKTVILLQLPKNVSTKLQNKEVLAWAYWIGAGKESEDAYALNLESFKTGKSSVKSPLLAFAKGESEELKTPKKGTEIQYYFLDNGKDADNFMVNKEFGYMDKGKTIVGYGAGNQRQGNFFIALRNINKDKNVDIYVKIIALLETKVYEFKEVKVPQTSKLKTCPTTSKQMIIKTVKVPTFAE